MNVRAAAFDFDDGRLEAAVSDVAVVSVFESGVAITVPSRIAGRMSQVVELRFFGGLTVEETAGVKSVTGNGDA
jgi:hypothetical protein